MTFKYSIKKENKLSKQTLSSRMLTPYKDREYMIDIFKIYIINFN
ncbi:hypothetical protein SB30_270012 [Klebsiella quasipneumoniae subsp. similipneumoniae]|nr:hypothetical protein SB30_270012 [Klebsiella quasipneumoniae subsp. similipneumoniae]